MDKQQIIDIIEEREYKQFIENHNMWINRFIGFMFGILVSALSFIIINFFRELK